MNQVTKIFSIILSFLITQNIFAVNYSENSPVGLWKTIDDVTGKPKSIVQIVENKDGSLSGKVIKLFQNPSLLCTSCAGTKHNQPVMNMVVMENYIISKENSSQWIKGKILDPKNGRVYKSILQLMENGQKLNVRGYIGLPLFGRSQNWVRVG